MADFVHLHNHSHYSLQDAAATVDSLVDAAVQNDMHALALTDHGVMYGAQEFYKKAKKAGIKPIIGMEAYIAREGTTRFDKGKSAYGEGRKQSKHYNHLLLLAKNETGYKNLIKLTSQAHTEGFYYRPRIDFDLLKERYEGLVCTSACLVGPIASLLINGEYEKAKETARKYMELFGDDFYLEIQNHNLEYDPIILEQVPKIAKELGIKLVATNDIHYINQEHSIAHNILLNLSDKSGSVDYQKLRYQTPQFYFKTIDEMKKLFKGNESALENTMEIEEKCNLELEFGNFHYPVFPIPEDSKATNLDEYFEILAREGLEKKFEQITPEIKERFNFEIDVIKKMGYSGYFLIVQDFINSARQRNIPVGPGRGSAAGSLVSYTLGITNVNPLNYDLLFERFLNPARESMPDIDIDFADDQRGEMIEYVRNKYGEESVCQIVTFNRLSSKAVLRDVARVLQIPIATVNNITKHIPSEFGRVYSLEKALNEVPELKWVKESKEPKIQELIKYGKILEGMNRNVSKHAAGVVITPGPVSNYVPLAYAGNAGDVVTQYNMKELDDAGILKMDFLGLRTLTILRDTLTLVKKNHNVAIDIEQIPVDDKETYELFSRGQTTAVFQFESPPMREYLRKLKPQSIKDLAAMNALYRPGPMEFINDFIDRRHGRKKVEYLHPNLEPILKETYGIIVYQEQVIQLANKIGGLSLAEADILRRAMGKKDLEKMNEMKEKFVKGAVENNISEKIAEEIFQSIFKFANYGFNKSHAVAYSYVAYQTAYLKAHYLPEFLAANLTNEFGNTDKVTVLLDDCRKLGVKVLPPDVNKPSVFFNVENSQIIFGMSAIKNVGVSAVEEISKKRNEIGRAFTSIYDFSSQIDLRIVNKRTIEGLVLSGAFDNCTGAPSQNFAAIESAIDFGNKVQSSTLNAGESLFGDSEETLAIEEPELPEVERWDQKETLAKEREVLGLYLSSHPLHKYEIENKSFANVNLGHTEKLDQESVVRAVGVITEVRTKITKSNKQMVFFKLDDLTGSCECIMFPNVYEECREFIEEESTILVKGKPESSGDSIKLHIDEAMPLSEAKNSLTKNLVLYLDDQEHTGETIDLLKQIFEAHSGNTPVYVSVKENGGERRFYLNDYKVKLDNGFAEELIKVLGSEYVRFAV